MEGDGFGDEVRELCKSRVLLSGRAYVEDEGLRPEREEDALTWPDKGSLRRLNGARRRTLTIFLRGGETKVRCYDTNGGTVKHTLLSLEQSRSSVP